MDGVVDIALADRFFCLYTAQNFTAVTLVGFGRGKDSAECGHLQISNPSVATVAILPVVLLNSETVDTQKTMPLKLEMIYPCD